MRLRHVLAGLLFLSVLAPSCEVRADFTSPENAQIARLAEATISARASARLVESTLAGHLTAENRPLYYAVEHTLGEVNEESSIALHLMFGAIAERGAAAKKALEKAPRSTFLAKAYAALDEALEEAEEAYEALEALYALFPQDYAYREAIATAQFHLRSARAKIAGFNRNLAYADPTPAGQDAMAFRDLQTAIYRMVTQYGYDSGEDLFEGALNTSEPVLSSSEAGFLASALSITWIIADDGVKAALRAGGIQIVAGEDPRLAALDQLLGAGTGGTTTRFQFALTNMSWLIPPACGRPVLMNGVIKAIENNVDSWKRMDNVARGFAH
jgi:hypothetical protein